MSCNNTSIAFEQGEDARFAFYPTADQIANGTIDLTGAALALTMFHSPSNSTPIATLTTTAGNITYSNATVGNYTVYFNRSLTSDLATRKYWYGVWRTDSGNYSKFAEGCITVTTPSYPVS